jgi:amidase
MGATPALTRIVGKLRASGAVILGKSNLSEWAGIRSTRSTAGGARGRLTPGSVLDQRHIGIEFRSAAAVAASLCAWPLWPEATVYR